MTGNQRIYFFWRNQVIWFQAPGLSASQDIGGKPSFFFG
jgi:hypothetical protein